MNYDTKNMKNELVMLVLKNDRVRRKRFQALDAQNPQKSWVWLQEGFVPESGMFADVEKWLLKERAVAGRKKIRTNKSLAKTEIYSI